MNRSSIRNVLCAFLSLGYAASFDMAAAQHAACAIKKLNAADHHRKSQKRGVSSGITHDCLEMEVQASHLTFQAFPNRDCTVRLNPADLKGRNWSILCVTARGAFESRSHSGNNLFLIKVSRNGAARIIDITLAPPSRSEDACVDPCINEEDGTKLNRTSARDARVRSIPNTG